MIKTTNLSKHFQNETAIDYRDLVFEDGKSYMLLGASGCGKSTLLNMIAGILSPDGGAIEIDGVEISSKPQSTAISEILRLDFFKKTFISPIQ